MVFYRKDSEQERPVIDFKEMMRRRYPDKEVQDEDLDTREGSSKAKIYGLVRYPAIVITTDDGRVQSMWEGAPLPLIDEVISYMLEQQGSSL